MFYCLTLVSGASTYICWNSMDKYSLECILRSRLRHENIIFIPNWCHTIVIQFCQNNNNNKKNLQEFYFSSINKMCVSMPNFKVRGFSILSVRSWIVFNYWIPIKRSYWRKLDWVINLSHYMFMLTYYIILTLKQGIGNFCRRFCRRFITIPTFDLILAHFSKKS